MSDKFMVISKDAEVLDKNFQELQFKDKQKIVLAAMVRAVQPTVHQARTNVGPGVTGDLVRSIGVTAKKRELAVYVGARTTSGNRGYHGLWYEDGTRERMTRGRGAKRKGRRSTGRMPARKFLARAVEATQAKVMENLANEWYHAIYRILNKKR